MHLLNKKVFTKSWWKCKALNKAFEYKNFYKRKKDSDLGAAILFLFLLDLGQSNIYK